MKTLPDVVAGHWTSPEGREMATEYAAMTRADFGKSDHSDFALANAIYMAGRNDLDLIVWQTAAKERMRWLSVQLHLAHAALGDHQALLTLAADFLEEEAGNRAAAGSEMSDYEREPRELAERIRAAISGDTA